MDILKVLVHLISVIADIVDIMIQYFVNETTLKKINKRADEFHGYRSFFLYS